jgi:hypothetical protein
MAWRNFVVSVDPDLIIGYNINNFDLPYLMDRAKALKLNKFPLLGRLVGAAGACACRGVDAIVMFVCACVRACVHVQHA